MSVLAAAMRVRHLRTAVAMHTPCLSLLTNAAAAAVGANARHLATSHSQDSPAIMAANARLDMKMAAIPRFQNMDPEVAERKKENMFQFFETRLKMDRLTAIRTAALHPLVRCLRRSQRCLFQSTNAAVPAADGLFSRGVGAQDRLAHSARH
jgi:hypothetical protein